MVEVLHEIKKFTSKTFQFFYQIILLQSKIILKTFGEKLASLKTALLFTHSNIFRLQTSLMPSLVSASRTVFISFAISLYKILLSINSIMSLLCLFHSWTRWLNSSWEENTSNYLCKRKVGACEASKTSNCFFNLVKSYISSKRCIAAKRVSSVRSPSLRHCARTAF